MSDIIQVKPTDVIERILSLELVRVTERAAVASALLRGRGDEKGADKAAVDAMRRELNKMPIQGTVVIGEGERDEAPMLFIGETVGTGVGPKVDIAVDPLEGTTLCAKDMPGSIAVMAMAERRIAAQRARRLHGQDRHRPRLSGRGRRPRRERWRKTSTPWPRPRASGRTELTALVLDRPRHAPIIAAIRKVGASIRVITRRRRRRRHLHRQSATRPASTSISAPAARRRACWRRRRCAASAARCRAG